MPPETPAQNRKQPDQRKTHRRQRRRKPTIRLHLPLRALGRRQRDSRMPQILRRSGGGIRHVHRLSLARLGQVDRVVVKCQQLQPAGLGVHLLARAILQLHDRPLRRDVQLAGARQNRAGRRLRLRVVNDDALQAVILPAALHINRNVVRNRREYPRLQQKRRDLIANLVLIIAERRQRGRHHDNIQHIANARHHHRQHQSRPRQHDV